MDVIGNVCRSRGMFKEARPLLEEALRIRQQLDPNDAQVASSLHNLAWLDFDTGNWKIAEQLYRQALAIRARQSGREGELAAANTKFNLAWLLGQSNRAREAEGLFREVLAVRTKHLGLGHRDVKIAAFAVILVRQPGPSDLLKEVDTVAAAVGPGEVAGMLSVGMTYFRAATLRRQGKYADAEPLYREVLAHLREHFGSDDNLFVPLLLGDYAGMLRQMGNLVEAEALFREAMTIGRRLVPNHWALADGQRELADYLCARGDFDEAAALLEDSVRILAACERPELANAIRSLGRVESGRGDYQRAEACFRKSLEMVERSQGPKSEIFSRKCDLANCLHDRCAFAEAEALVRDAVSMKRSLFAGLDDAHYLQWQADFLRDQGRHEEAAHLDHEALAMVRNRTARVPRGLGRSHHVRRRAGHRRRVAGNREVPPSAIGSREKALAGGEPQCSPLDWRSG